MIQLPRKYRSDDDDYAPLDYQYVGSVAEGQRQRGANPIHREATSAVIRHRADPHARVDAYGTHARQPRVSQRENPRRQERPLPFTEEGPRVQRVAYPEDCEESCSLEASSPFAAVEDQRTYMEAPDESVTSHELAKQEEPPAAPEFDAPVAPEIPEWLRVARQNNMPLENRQLRPRVTAAPVMDPKPTDLPGRPMREPMGAQSMATLPQTAAAYAEAGYPPELLRQQELYDQDCAAERYGPQRHGAQRAVRTDHNAGRRQRAERVRQAYDQSGYGTRGTVRLAAPQYPLSPDGDSVAGEWSGAEQPTLPYVQRENIGNPDYEGYEIVNGSSAQDKFNRRRERPATLEPDDPIPEEVRRNVPWLGIAAATLALIAVLLWILQISFEGRTEDQWKANAQAQEAIAQAHPYKYRELIETQAQVNNLHPAFIAAIILNESSFQPNAESSVGARGLMQMMPDTAEWVHGKIGEHANYDFDMMYDAATNVRYACWYMNFLSERFRGDPVLVAAAFHAGQSTVQSWLNDSRYSEDSQTIELENMMDGPTKNYASRVLKAYAVYKRLYYESTGV